MPCDEPSKEPRETWQDVGGLIAQKVPTVCYTVSQGRAFQTQTPERFTSCLQKRPWCCSAVFWRPVGTQLQTWKSTGAPRQEGKVGSLCWKQRDTEMQQKCRAVCAPPLLFVLHTAPGAAPCWSAALAQANPSCVQETEA